MKERIKAYLADGLTGAQISTILGCSPSYISQLLKDETFKLEVEAALINNQKPADEVLETRYTSLEHNIVKRMQEELPGAELPHLTKALEAVTKANDSRFKRKHPGLLGNTGTNITQVANIYLPQHALPPPVMTLNERSEVVAIDNKPLAPMSANGVKNLFAQMTAKNNINEFEVINNGPKDTLEQATSSSSAAHSSQAASV